MEGNGMTLQGAATLSQGTATLPQGAATLPQGAAITISQDTAILPQGTAVPLQGAATTVQGTLTPLEDAATTLQRSAGSRRRSRTYRGNASMEQRLLLAQVAIEGVLADRDLQTALALRGYDQARMMEGKALRDQAEALFQQQRARSGAQRKAKDARDTAQAQAHTFYIGLVALARVALRDEPGMAKTLDLTRQRKRTVAGWLAQAKQFYVNALNDAAILDKLAACGITQEELEQGRLQVEAVAAGEVAREQRKGAKQETTRVRDAALKALDRWMQDFRAVARVALARQPQTLEKLGVVVPSSPAT